MDSEQCQEVEDNNLDKQQMQTNKDRGLVTPTHPKHPKHPPTYAVN